MRPDRLESFSGTPNPCSLIPYFRYPEPLFFLDPVLSAPLRSKMERDRLRDDPFSFSPQGEKRKLFLIAGLGRMGSTGPVVRAKRFRTRYALCACWESGTEPCLRVRLKS